MCPQVEKLLADAVALMEEGDAPSGLMFNCMYGHYKIAFEVRPPAGSADGLGGSAAGPPALPHVREDHLRVLFLRVAQLPGGLEEQDGPVPAVGALEDVARQDKARGRVAGVGDPARQGV